MHDASLLLHQLDSPELGPQATAQLKALVLDQLKLTMTVQVVKPLLIWELGSLDLETGEATPMPLEMYR